MGCEVIELGGGKVFMCSRWGDSPRVLNCHYCSRPGTRLCDWPLEVVPEGKYPKTCDRRLCAQCAAAAGPGKDHCRAHQLSKETKMTATLVPYMDKPKETGIPKKGLFLLIGDVKSGKTTFAASFPASYVLELERGRGDRIKRGRIHDIGSLQEYGDVLDAALNEPSVETVVIDSVDVLAKWLQQEISGPTRIFGKAEKGVDTFDDYNEFEFNVRAMTDFLKASGKLVIIVAHRRMAKVDKDKNITKPAGINVPTTGGDYIAQQAEMVGFMGVRVLGNKAQHYLTFKGESDRAIWRSGIDELRDKETVIPESDPYGAFARMFDKQEERAPAKLVPAGKAAPAKSGARRK